jgi:hypothetical protein
METDIQQLLDELAAAERDARGVADGLTEAEGTWRSPDGSWTVAECLDHLGTANRVYLDAMDAPAARAQARGRTRRGPARPGIVGRWFARSLEPPVRRRLRAPRTIRPRTSPPLADALRSFLESHQRARAFVQAHRGLDLAGVRFPNPFIRGVRFSLATGLHVITAHERRHLWQAWNVRRQAERAAGR